MFPSSPGLPSSCSAVLSVGILEPKCSELEVSTKTPGGDRSGSGSQAAGPKVGLGPQAQLTHRLSVGDAMLGQHTLKSFNLL